MWQKYSQKKFTKKFHYLNFVHKEFDKVEKNLNYSKLISSVSVFILWMRFKQAK